PKRRRRGGVRRQPPPGRRREHLGPERARHTGAPAVARARRAAHGARDVAAAPVSAVRTVGLLGGGVIGGGWAARFLLQGIDVRLYDPDPESGRKLGETLELARTALRQLSEAPPAREGSLTLVPTAAAAAEGAELVQESAPERIELKRALLAEVAAAAGPEVLIASST